LLTYAFERNHPDGAFNHAGDALWWAIVTATTVGYGDFSPVSSEGRAVAVVLMLVGIGLLSVVTANVAAFMVESGEGDGEEGGGLAEVNARLERIEAALDEIRAVQR
jgi:voltage-gated potassium channel